MAEQNNIEVRGAREHNLKSVDEDIINDHLQKLKRDNNLPLIVKLMERVNKPPKSSSN